MAKEKKPKTPPVDGLSPKDAEKIVRALRQVWSWSYPRRLCIKNATDEEGFATCVECNKKVAKVYVDHIVPVGKLDAGTIERMWCPSAGLRALCKSCHSKKTRQEAKDKKIEEDLPL